MTGIKDDPNEFSSEEEGMVQTEVRDNADRV
jgi:hypothetical protein